jgi:hypothetical protein
VEKDASLDEERHNTQQEGFSHLKKRLENPYMRLTQDRFEIFCDSITTADP